MTSYLVECRQDVKLKVYDFRMEGENKVHTKWRFSCVLNLPWRPLLAAAGGCCDLRGECRAGKGLSEGTWSHVHTFTIDVGYIRALHLCSSSN